MKPWVDFGFKTVNSDLLRLKRLSVNDTDDMNELIVKASGLWEFVRAVLGWNREFGWTDQVEEGRRPVCRSPVVIQHKTRSFRGSTRKSRLSNVPGIISPSWHSWVGRLIVTVREALRNRVTFL
jgi:hypothetical protein